MRLLYFCLLSGVAHLTWCSSLKGSKGILLEKDPGLKCHTEYDDVWEEKCSTLYEDQCSIVSKKECRQTLDQQCSLKEEETCAFTTTQKCSSIPIPKCGILWEKSCSSHPVCQTHHEKQCSTVHRPKCHFQHEKICTQVKETLCREKEVVHEKGLLVKGAIHEKGQLIKGAIHEKGQLVKGAIHEKGQLVKGAIHEKGELVKGVINEKGLLAKGALVDSPAADVHSVYKRSADQQPTNLTNATGSKLTAKEAYAIHKQTLLDLKKKVENELAAIEREEAANVTGKEADHKLSKRSRSAIVDLNPSRKQQKRSLETLKQQLYSEIQILEEGDFTGDIEQINEKRRKRSLKAEEGPADEDPQRVSTKRFSKDHKGKGTIGIEDHKECWDEPREKCTSIPREVCETVAEELCTDVPRQTCEEVETCKDLPKKDCQIIYKEICATLPTRECHTSPREVCVDVPKEICEDVPKEVCVSVPGKRCEKVVVKRPREVCLPPQKVRVLDAVAASVHSEPSSELY